MSTAPNFALPGYIPAQYQVVTTPTVSSLVRMFTAPINIKDSPDTTSTAGAVQTPALSPTPIPPYSASIDWSPGVKFALFVLGAFVCLIFFFIVLGIIRKIRDEVRSQRAAEQRIREDEDRRREAALQWQRLELERNAEDERAWEMQMHQRIARYAEQVEEAEVRRLCNIPLAADGFAQARDGHRYIAENPVESSQVVGENQGERKEAKDDDKSREPNKGDDKAVVSGESEAQGQKTSETDSSSDSSMGKTIETRQHSSQTELDRTSSTPLTSDEVLRAVHALGYESISDSLRAKARARALKDLEGH
jgi:hypothetical protein